MTGCRYKVNGGEIIPKIGTMRQHILKLLRE